MHETANIDSPIDCGIDAPIDRSAFRFCVAPMMDWTDRHDRYFLRLISRHARLYTEMVTADAVRFGCRDRLLGFDKAEHPLGLQLGGSEPNALAEAAQIGESYGYDEINLNIGCPSHRVQSGRFGACLMQEPKLVADCVAAMRAAVKIPISIKCRLGVDEQEPRKSLFELVEQTAAANCHIFIVHARKAWLSGLSPRQNRDIPPLDYELVYELKKTYPQLTIILNGGIETLQAAGAHMPHVDGVMLGRAAYKRPYMLADVDALFYGDMRKPLSREEIICALIPYAENLVRQNVPLHALTRHLMGLYAEQPGARIWRQWLSEHAPRAKADVNVLSTFLTAQKMRTYESQAHESRTLESQAHESQAAQAYECA